MNAVFLGFFNRAVTAGWLVLAVLVLRLLLRRAPKRLTCALWAVVAVRLLLPFSVPSPLSLVPSVQTVVPESIHTSRPIIETGIQAVNGPVSHYLQSVYYEGVTVPAGTAAHTADLMTVLWIAGAAVLALYCLGTWLHLRFRLRTAVRLRDNLWQSEWVDSPFVLGLFRPRIYLPFRLSPEDLAVVEAHERAHVVRGDHIWRLLAFLLLALHWFHPLLWVAYFCFCRDLEYACDEQVVRTLDDAGRRQYSAALLRCAAPRRAVAPCPVAFGEAGVSGRIKTVLNYRRPAFWVVLLAVLALIVTALCFLTDPPIKSAAQWLHAPGTVRLDQVEICVNHDGSGQSPYYNFTSFTGQHRKTLASLLRQVDTNAMEEAGHRPLPPTFCSLFFPKHGVYLSLPETTDSAGDEVELQYRDQLYLIHDRELADFLRGVLPGSALTWYQHLPRGDKGNNVLALDLRLDCAVIDITYMGGMMDRGTMPSTVLNGDGTSYGQGGSASVLGGSRITWKPGVLDETRGYDSADMTFTLTGGPHDHGKLVLDLRGTPDYQGSTLVGMTYRLVVLNNTFPVTATIDGDILRLWDDSYDAPEFPENMRSEDGIYYEDYWGAVYWDIDGDGVKEACSLGVGPTSGLYSIAVAARVDGAIQYADLFLPGSFGLPSFVCSGKGLQVAMTEYTGDGSTGETFLYDVTVRDGHIVLTGEDGEMSACG